MNKQRGMKWLMSMARIPTTPISNEFVTKAEIFVRRLGLPEDDMVTSEVTNI
jgi:hypothetical protein